MKKIKNKWDKFNSLEDQIRFFNSIPCKNIIDMHYYVDYDSNFDLISFLEIKFSFEIEEITFISIKFINVSAFFINDFGGSYNEVLGLKINNISNRGFELSNRFFIEDYENDDIQFYCQKIEFLINN